MHPQSTHPQRAHATKRGPARRSFIHQPVAYWDRTDNVVRDWQTNQPLPHYEGPCMYYSDLRGAVVMDSFLRDGKRHWIEAPQP